MSDTVSFDTLEHLGSGTWVSFTVAGELFCVDVTTVVEILSLPKITKVPRLPESLLGIINLRGKVLPVLSLQKQMEMGSHDQNHTSVLIISTVVNGTPTLWGAAIDSVEALISAVDITIPHGDIRENAEFIKGIIEANNLIYRVVDLELLFGNEKIQFVRV